MHKKKFLTVILINQINIFIGNKIMAQFLKVKFKVKLTWKLVDISVNWRI